MRAANLMLDLGGAPAGLSDTYRAALESVDEDLRILAMRSLVDLDEKPDELTDVVVGALEDGHASVRQLALVVWLRVAGLRTPEAIEAVREATQDRSEEVRALAVEVLESSETPPR